MGPWRPLQRWRACGKPQRTEIYVRWSLYAMVLVQPLVVVGTVNGPAGLAVSRPVAVASLALSLAGSVLAFVLFRRGLDHYLGRRERPTGWILAAVLLMVGGVSGLLLIDPTVRGGGSLSNAPTISSLLVLWFAPVSVALRSRRTAALVAAGALLLTVPAMAAAGLPAGSVLGLLLGAAISLTVVAATCRCSAWLAGVVWELDEAREKQSQLAVAEERLRFSRDLHDVLGRNLTTIALKSELAVQLARRGRPEAADQMTEVQRIAQESQREVREVVRGYRTADLRAEVAGARSVLRAAGVVCAVDLGPDPAALTPVAHSVLGWVVREATTNVLRHSEASHCSIRLRAEDGRAVLEVENDGVPTGLTDGREDGREDSRGDGAHPGTGLTGLGERLAAHGGALTLPATAPGSFRITAVLPLAAPAPALEVAAR
ncbi:sensor histidine kinase [Kitasatospora sp. NBC_00374]|uniref:sensor histidine kinase n=1 Tax=Kitasatospora sp. NBC_00374 TaxID=2975964 RepID=UPI00324E087D